MTAPIGRREAIVIIGATSAVCALGSVIRYEIDPYQREAFKEYAQNWGRIIPRCGGHLVGYFLPYDARR